MAPADYLRYVIALAAVLGLILILGQLAKTYNWAQLGIKLSHMKADKRLRIVEVQAIDTRHRLLIARRDDVEYVLVVSPEQVTLLDTVPAHLSATVPSETAR